MFRSKVTAIVFSLMLLVGLSALADGPGEERGDSNPNQAILLEGTEGAAPEERVEGVASNEHEESDAVVPIYVPSNRGSTLAQDGSGVTGARRPGVRL
jgi:hypothetical protein